MHERPQPPGLRTLIALSLGFLLTTLPASAEAERSGAFRSGAHPTRGQATLTATDDGFVVELDEAFRSDAGPDLFVVLHEDAKPRRYSRGNHLILGKLEKLRGKQRYALPASFSAADAERYSSVVIWCKRFDVTFGHAVLGD